MVPLFNFCIKVFARIDPFEHPRGEKSKQITGLQLKLFDSSKYYLKETFN